MVFCGVLAVRPLPNRRIPLLFVWFLAFPLLPGPRLPWRAVKITSQREPKVDKFGLLRIPHWDCTLTVAFEVSALASRILRAGSVHLETRCTVRLVRLFSAESFATAQACCVVRWG